mgnify:FL=1|tara:strand:- start:1812 stop:2111 length:300 start_codon:yes stop_codon:yes gene_type:complete
MGNIIYVDIDNTICTQVTNSKYEEAKPWYDNIEKINVLYDEGNHIKYWTARGSTSGNDYYQLTKKQLDDWGCKYHELSVGEKPFYDLLICDRTKRIEEI